MIRGAAAALLLALLAGCSVRPRLTDYSLGGTALDQASRRTILETVDRRARAVTALRGLYRCEIVQGGPADAWRYVIVYAPPSRLRVEIVPLNGFYTLGLFIFTDAGGSFVDTDRKEVVTSSDPGKVLADSLRLPISVDDFGAILSGVVPSEVRSALAESEATALVGGSQDGSADLKTDSFFGRLAPDGSLKAAHFFAGDSLREVLRVEVPEYGVAGNIQLPHRLVIGLLEHGVTVTCAAQNLAVNTPVRPALFELQIPAGYGGKSLD